MRPPVRRDTIRREDRKMSTDLEAITAVALALSEADRANLVVRLMESLDGGPSGRKTWMTRRGKPRSPVAWRRSGRARRRASRGRKPASRFSAVTMTTPVNFHRHAIQVGRRIERRYARAGTGVLARFTAAFDDAVARIDTYPAMWPPDLHGTRACRLRKFPYRLVYVEELARVLVFAVAHNRRRPGYWRRRLPP